MKDVTSLHFILAESYFINVTQALAAIIKSPVSLNGELN